MSTMGLLRRSIVARLPLPALAWCCLVALARPAEPIFLARPDAFQTLVNPECSHCIDEAKARARELSDDDPVLAWTRGKYEGGAVPIRFFLNPFRVISDSYGVFVYDPDAGFARGYAPSYDFTFHGWRGGIVVLRHKDGTLFSALSGRAFAGPRSGERLEPIATMPSTWGYWRAAYPGSVAYRMFEKYRPTELPHHADADSLATRGSPDPRLPPAADALGVAHLGAARAYPLDALPAGGGVRADTLAGQSIVVLWYPPTLSAAAYLPQLEDADPPVTVELSFDPAEPAAPFLDAASGSRFGVEGRAVSGPLKGRALQWIDSVQCRWFAWAAEYPETTIDERQEPLSRAAPAAPAPAAAADPIPQLVLVEPADVTPARIAAWRGEGFAALVLRLDDDVAADVYQAAARAARDAGIDWYYWIEVGRCPALADAQPRWLAALGVHDDWRERFPAIPAPEAGQVAKAYPWVPIGYAEAFAAHLARIERLLAKAPAGYRGLLLNDLQGGPASCGCGNLQCRWAIDYGVPSTATPDGVDDAAARFVARVRQLAPGSEVIPVWMSECEEIDLPGEHLPDGKSTGLCGHVACAKGTCPHAFRKQLTALLAAHAGPVGLLAAQEACGRDAAHYGGAAGWIAAAVEYLDRSPVFSGGPLPRQRLWLVVQGTEAPLEQAARHAARLVRPGAIVVARVALDQTYEPRVICVEQNRKK